LVFPRGQPRLKRRGVVNFGVVEHQYRGASARGGLGSARVEDKGCVQRACAGGGEQVVGGGVEKPNPLKRGRWRGWAATCWPRNCQP